MMLRNLDDLARASQLARQTRDAEMDAAWR